MLDVAVVFMSGAAFGVVLTSLMFGISEGKNSPNSKN